MSHRRKPRKVGTERNDLCPCGSGKKHKKCCMMRRSTVAPEEVIHIDEQPRVGWKSMTAINYAIFSSMMREQIHGR